MGGGSSAFAPAATAASARRLISQGRINGRKRTLRKDYSAFFPSRSDMIEPPAMLAPPVLAWVLRGDRVESAHRGSVAVVDESGNLVASAGDPASPIYLRAAAKPFQAMAPLEAGGEKAFRLGNDEIALTCASHGGEPRHVRVAARLLGKGGFTVADLACGAHAPMDEASARRLTAAGRKATPLHNNCSGKHAGLLLA